MGPYSSPFPGTANFFAQEQMSLLSAILSLAQALPGHLDAGD
jgi:hypothetical protein